MNSAIIIYTILKRDSEGMVAGKLQACLTSILMPESGSPPISREEV
jgi:hypothetical protein